MLVTGVFGYVMIKFRYPLTGLILGLVLGPKAEEYFIQSVELADWDFTIFFTRPICIVLWVCIAASLIGSRNWRDRSCTGSSRKSRRTTSRLRATVHRWPSPSGPAGKALAWGKRGRAKLARIYHRPINSNFLLKIIGHVPVLLGHFD